MTQVYTNQKFRTQTFICPLTTECIYNDIIMYPSYVGGEVYNSFFMDRFYAGFGSIFLSLNVKRRWPLLTFNYDSDKINLAGRVLIENPTNKKLPPNSGNRPKNQTPKKQNIPITRKRKLYTCLIAFW